MTEPLKLGPVELAPGVTRLNAATKLYASGVTIAALTGMSILQGFILTEHLDVPRRAQGTLSGDLSFWTEIVMLVALLPAGILADRIGRRPVYITGVLLIALAWGLYPFATSTTELFIYRTFYGAGVAAATGTLATMVNDYPLNSSRGKYIGLSAMMNVLGTIFAARIIGGIPEQMGKLGYSPVESGTVMFLSMTVLLVITAVIARVGLMAGTPVTAKERLPARQLYGSGLRAGRNPRIAISYFSALAARSDVVVKGLFLSLWAIQSGRELNISTGEAMARYGTAIAVMYAVSFFSAPAFGWFIDRVDRMTAMCVALVVAAGGYLSMYFLTSPVDFRMLPLLIIMTLGTGFMVKAQMALVGEEAPVKERGSVIATAQMFGAFGILVFTVIGGRLFDAWGPWAPFVLVGGYQAVLLVGALLVRFRSTTRSMAASMRAAN
ncbi:MAG: MFS transporter [Gammaproteobacteria bacterium]|nr:MFS transporter [Gammaproteobacteria bacterium]NND54841.1 MFS transporter [Gammaproteobacteria bacterium]